jgi:hypothetical protein
MRTLLFALAILILAFPLILTAQTTADKPLRTVKGQTLTSNEIPVASLTFGKNFKYAGGHRFILYGVAHAEQHFFVDAGKDGRVKRMYWVQFEGYLPDNTHSYKLTVTRSVDIGGFSFIADAYARNIRTNPGRPDSDGALARNFLAQNGYRLGSDEIISQRLIHLIGDDKRNELMIIYLEDMSGLGLTSADLADGGKAGEKRKEVYEALLGRAFNDLKILR